MYGLTYTLLSPRGFYWLYTLVKFTRRARRLLLELRLLAAANCSCVAWGWRIYNIVESESDPLTHRAVDLFEKEPFKCNSEVHLHTPTKFGEDPSKDLGGDREQTDQQRDRQTLLELWYDEYEGYSTVIIAWGWDHYVHVVTRLWWSILYLDITNSSGDHLTDPEYIYNESNSHDTSVTTLRPN